MLSFYQFTSQMLQDHLHGFSHDISNKLFKEFYQATGKLENCQGLIAEDALQWLQVNLNFSLPKITTCQLAADETVKFLLEFADGEKVETVLIPFHKRYTICLSSQVGCGMKCSFCYTGTQGLKRNLKAEEIIGQYVVAWQWLKKNRPEKSLKPNIVFMGQGEPLHNFDQVKLATEIFLENAGLNLGSRQITLSTAGFLPGLMRFHEFPRINLALSLHSAFDNIRNELIPLNRSYSLSQLFQVLDTLPRLKRQYLTMEYLLIKDINDTEKDARALIALLKDRPAIINLIPFNEFPGAPYQRPTPTTVNWFRELLVEARLPVMLRTTKGDDILAACGQLKSLKFMAKTEDNRLPINLS